jgi:hypothetical protein
MPSNNDQDVSAMLAGSIPEDNRSSSDENTRILLAARRLTVAFADEADLPARFRKPSSSAQSRKQKKESEVEKRYKASVRSWTQLIRTMLHRIDNQQAWRFIELSPEIAPRARKLSDCEDFCDFMDYLILRRDKEQCHEGELGGLAMLSTAFQREIEKRILPLPGPKTSEPAKPDQMSLDA